MRVPQLNERVKEAPAHALRAVFGGIGSLLSVSDKIRNKPAASKTTASAPTVASETAAPQDTVMPEATVAPEDVAAPAAATPEAAAAAAATSVDAAPEAAAPVAAAAPEAAATPDDSAALPLANYDALTIASLRARLRNLSADQLTQLIDYEKAHANRAEVVTMFERRITKLNLGLTQALPKVTE
jgi:hypothetical protein